MLTKIIVGAVASNADAAASSATQGAGSQIKGPFGQRSARPGALKAPRSRGHISVRDARAQRSSNGAVMPSYVLNSGFLVRNPTNNSEAHMIDSSKRHGTFAGVVALTAVLLIVPALAQTTSPPPAPPSAPAPAPSTKAPAKPMSHHMSAVDARIRSLHARLHITAAQEPQWEQVAAAMRENAATIDKMARERNAKLRTMNAVENLQTYAAIADAHADGLKKLAPAFDSLYQAMSPAQQKNADAVFRAIAEHYARHTAPKTKPAAPAQK